MSDVPAVKARGLSFAKSGENFVDSTVQLALVLCLTVKNHHLAFWLIVAS